MEEEVVKVGYGYISIKKTSWGSYPPMLELEYEVDGHYGEEMSHDISKEEAIELVKLLEKFIKESK